MTRDPRVQLGNARGDRPQALLLLAIAIGTFVAGLGVARGLTRSDRERAPVSARMSNPITPSASAPNANAQSTHAQSTHAQSVAPAQTAAPHAVPEPRQAAVERDALAADAGARTALAAPAPPLAQTSPAPRSESPTQAPAQPRQAAEPQTPPVPVTEAPRPQAPRMPVQAQAQQVRAQTPRVVRDAGVAAERAPATFNRVFVAYVRCDGLPQSPGRFPCPRDPWLETHVWRALSELPQCKAAAAQRGQGDLRLDFDRYGAVALHFEPKGEGLDPEAVIQCAEPRLGRIHTSLRAEHLLVSFRFELR
jgi:hypothetical protein